MHGLDSMIFERKPPMHNYERYPRKLFVISTKNSKILFPRKDKIIVSADLGHLFQYFGYQNCPQKKLWRLLDFENFLILTDVFN